MSVGMIPVATDAREPGRAQANREVPTVELQELVVAQTKAQEPNDRSDDTERFLVHEKQYDRLGVRFAMLGRNVV
jgi:hypothetical protein